ncbi:MAG: cupin domain-containing protein [Planctomycetota bacterium]|jgi:mannose-6-phosphate isomerase-like protein (cupin superfamily)
MLIKRLKSCPEIVANDGCRLRELLHPDRDDADVAYSLAVAWVDPGERTHAHTLRRQTEVYLVVIGKGTMHIDDEVDEVEEGDAVVIPPGRVQWIENPGPDRLCFAALVSPPWQAEDDVRA